MITSHVFFYERTSHLRSNTNYTTKLFVMSPRKSHVLIFESFQMENGQLISNAMEISKNLVIFIVSK